MTRGTSKDGTLIAYERSGNGPALILVDGALCSRAFGPSPKLAPLLARHFTVYAYDRRGRGQSGDTQPYSPAREVEDIAALVEAAGGSAVLLGLSSGGTLALEAAASGLPVTRLVAYEPPCVDDNGERGSGCRARFASIGVPSLVMNGAKTDRRLREAVQTIVNAMPAAHHRELAGQTHNVKPDADAGGRGVLHRTGRRCGVQ
jgi:dienelactone hydrolase